MTKETGDVSVSFTPYSGGEYTIRLYGEFDSLERFIPALETLEQAQDGDVVYLHLQGSGGDMDIADAILQAMNECEARVVVRASGRCHSAASLILLSATEFTLSDNFNCLIHCGSVGTNGTLSEFREHSRFYITSMEKMLSEAYKGFLTEDELSDLIGGRDFFLDKEAFLERWHKREEWRKANAPVGGVE